MKPWIKTLLLVKPYFWWHAIYSGPGLSENIQRDNGRRWSKLVTWRNYWRWTKNRVRDL